MESAPKARQAWIVATVVGLLAWLPGCSQPETIYGAREPVPVPPKGHGLVFRAASDDPSEELVIVYTAPLPSVREQRRQAVHDIHAYYLQEMARLEWNLVAEAPPDLHHLRTQEARIFLGCTEWNRGVKETTIWVAAMPGAFSELGAPHLRLEITFSASCQGYSVLPREEARPPRVGARATPA